MNAVIIWIGYNYPFVQDNWWDGMGSSTAKFKKKIGISFYK